LKGIEEGMEKGSIGKVRTIGRVSMKDREIGGYYG
jgi:hypothetical protein